MNKTKFYSHGASILGGGGGGAGNYINKHMNE